MGSWGIRTEKNSRSWQEGPRSDTLGSTGHTLELPGEQAKEVVGDRVLQAAGGLLKGQGRLRGRWASELPGPAEPRSLPTLTLLSASWSLCSQRERRRLGGLGSAVG